jgi:hypothetical protein
MFFDHLDGRNAMVKFIPYFDNFVKWIILVFNITVRGRNSVARSCENSNVDDDIVVYLFLGRTAGDGGAANT